MPDPATPDLPAEGGSYTRDPKTSVLMRTAETVEPIAPAPIAPTEPSEDEEH
jgi:hypothetical protein